MLSAFSSKATIAYGMRVHNCIRCGQLACFGRHYECWKLYKGFRATYAPLQMTCISAGQYKTTYCSYYNRLLQCSSGWTSNTIKPLQMIQNAAARLVFNEPKRAHVTPLFVSLHWLPVAARMKFKTLMLAYKTTTGSAPTYFHSLLRIYIPSRSLRSASERRLVVPSQRGSKSLSRKFSFTVPGWWNDLPTPIRTAGSLSTFKQQLKTHLFQHYLTS